MTPPQSAARAKTSLLRRAWGTTWRLVACLAIGLVAFALVYADEPLPEVPTPASDRVAALMVLDLVCAVVAMAIYPFRRRFPVVIPSLLMVLAGFSTLSVGLASFAMVSVATRRNPREIAFVALIALVAQAMAENLLSTTDPTPWWAVLLVWLGMYTILILSGLYIGGRRELLAMLREQAAGSLREQAALLDGARANERTRIAREMHDVLAHRLSLVALHAGALEYRSDLGPERTAQAAGVIRDNAHLALEELREVLGLLREETDSRGPEATRPQPSLAGLGSLITEMQGTGTQVRLSLPPELESNPQLVPDSIGRHLYRIIQEGLTNARRHAPGAPVTVTVGGREGRRISVSIENPIPDPATAAGVITRSNDVPASGLGLAGLSERANLAGGSLDAGPDGLGRFVLEAWLPWKK